MAIIGQWESSTSKTKNMGLKNAYIISAARTSVVPVGGYLRNTPIAEMASVVINENLMRLNIPKSEVDDIFVSNAIGGGGNIARLCALKAGFSENILGTSIDRQCVGGLDAILQAAKQIQNGEADLILAGGVTSFSLRPQRHYTTAWGETPKALERPPFYPEDDPIIPLGVTIKSLKEAYHISDKEVFDWVQNSHQKTIAHKVAIKDEIVALSTNDQIDPFARLITQETFNKAKAKFGHTHPCNTAPRADGAAFVSVASEAFVKKHKPTYCVKISDGITIAGNPKSFPILPASAMKQILNQNALKWDNISQLELMEAYAVQAILCAKLSGAPLEIINPFGGAISRGHPIGASGAILAVRLFHSLKNTKKVGMAAIAGAGGLATVMLLNNA